MCWCTRASSSFPGKKREKRGQVSVCRFNSSHSIRLRYIGSTLIDSCNNSSSGQRLLFLAWCYSLLHLAFFLLPCAVGQWKWRPLVSPGTQQDFWVNQQILRVFYCTSVHCISVANSTFSWDCHTVSGGILTAVKNQPVCIPPMVFHHLPHFLKNYTSLLQWNRDRESTKLIITHTFFGNGRDLVRFFRKKILSGRGVGEKKKKRLKR